MIQNIFWREIKTGTLKLLVNKVHINAYNITKDE